MIRVYVRHVMAAGFCARGFVVWAKDRGLDLRRFFTEGFPVEEVEALDDAMALAVAQKAREEALNGQ